MRKIFFIIIAMLAVQFSFAQLNVTFSPATFTGDDQVTLTIDVTGTGMAGETEAYMWIWANKDADHSTYPDKDGFTNTDWGNAPLTAKMTFVSANKFSYTLTGTNMFAPLTPGQLKHFQFLVKAKNGSKQTNDSQKFPFAPISYVPAVYRIYPQRTDKDDAITIYFYKNLATDLTEARMTPLTATIKLYDNTSTQVGAAMTLPVTAIGDKLYQVKGFIPNILWTVPASTTLQSFSYVINGTAYDINGVLQNVSGTVNTKTFDSLHL
jgi:hypothetical protein